MYSGQSTSKTKTSPYGLNVHLHLSRSLADRWDTAGDFTTNFFRSSRSSAFRSMMFQPRPVYSLIPHRFLCFPLRLPPCTVFCRTVLIVRHAHTTSVCVFFFFFFSFFLKLKSGSLHTAPMAFSVLVFTFHWLCDLSTKYQGVCGSISSSLAVSFFQCLLLRSTFHMHTNKWT